MGIFAVLAVISMVTTTIAALVLGLQLLPQAEPIHVLIVFDVLVVMFLFFWAIGFLGELQRSEPLEIGKLLHLPMSLRGAFLLNYLSSFASLTIAFLLPVMVALCIAMAFVFGWKSLISIPLIAGFISLITAITYQIRGWLAKLMSSPRRRRSIITGFTIVFILMFQLPNAFNMIFMKRMKNQGKAKTVELEKLNEIIENESLPEEDRATARTRFEKLTDPEVIQAEKAESWKQTQQTAYSWFQKINAWLPIGWMPLGIYRSLQGSLWQGLLGSLGLFGLAGLSLGSAYRTTLRYYRKAPDAPRVGAGSGVPKAPKKTKVRKNALAKPFPWTHPVPGTIARANLCSMLRAPEFKMMLIGPIIIVVLMCVPLATNAGEISAKFGPLIATGMAIAGMIVALPITMNQFGFDRHAFRSYMLLPVTGRDILLGKNISLAPVMIPIGLVSLIVVQIFRPVGLFDFLAILLQIVSAFITVCFVGNYFSTLFPMAIASSAMRKVQPKWQVIVAQMASLLILPLLLLPIVLPTLIGLANNMAGVAPGVPISFILSIPVFVGVVWIYRSLIGHTGELLQRRSQKILAEITRHTT